MKILVVEDNVDLALSVKEILSDEFHVDVAFNGEEGLYQALQQIYDLLVLDVMLPDLSGFDIIKEFRKQNKRTPVLFLTAKDALEDRVQGLDYGADDYLVKPFQSPELRARIRALLRRRGDVQLDASISYRSLLLHAETLSFSIEGETVKLTKKQYELLEYLVQNAGTIITKEQLFDRVWGFDSDTTIAIVEVFVHQLRKKLEPFHYEKDIQTVRGIGYLLKQPQV